jgi:hypothetical protein
MSFSWVNILAVTAGGLRQGEQGVSHGQLAVEQVSVGNSLFTPRSCRRVSSSYFDLDRKNSAQRHRAAVEEELCRVATSGWPRV